ncbi:MAG: hypothetical protein ABJA16_09700 [Nakamurella sp.]
MDTSENQLDQFGLGPEDDAHDDTGKPRKGTAAEEPDDSSVNTYGMGPEDKEQHHHS